MFLQRRVVAAVCELAIETVLEIRVSILRKPVTLCQANEQEEDGVRNQSQTSFNSRGHAEKKRTNAIRLFLSQAHMFICHFLSHVYFHPTKPVFTLISVHYARVEVDDFWGGLF